MKAPRTMMATGPQLRPLCGGAAACTSQGCTCEVCECLEGGPPALRAKAESANDCPNGMPNGSQRATEAQCTLSVSGLCLSFVCSPAGVSPVGIPSLRAPCRKTGSQSPIVYHESIYVL